ncbi:MAG: hypothetical protein IJP34_04670 [Clostridia bacterium]|nr:hypothetical protein [Clostridia bacterium]
MKIQFVSYIKGNITGKYDYTCSTLKAPNTLDTFDINIFSLQNENIWKTKDDTISYLNCTNDFNSIREMILNSNKSVNIIALPQNYSHYYDKSFSSDKYYKYYELKDNLNNLKIILSSIVPSTYIGNYKLIYENSETNLNGKKYCSAFSFKETSGEITRSNGGNRATTIRVGNLVLTTLNLSSPQTTIDDFIDGIGLGDKEVEIPDWLKNLECFDDKIQKQLIDDNNEKIKLLVTEINSSEEKLKKNERYKSILITNGYDLSSIVFEMLENLLKCNLSGFTDENKEDFLIKKENVTFIGEIKGITSNVKSENVAQVDRHYYSYLDKLKEANITENVKQLLIITPFRNKPLSEREAVNEDQINLAKRNNSLIITTDVFLKTFELFVSGEIKTEKIITAFQNEVGLFDIGVLK